MAKSRIKIQDEREDGRLGENAVMLHAVSDDVL